VTSINNNTYRHCLQEITSIIEKTDGFCSVLEVHVGRTLLVRGMYMNEPTHSKLLVKFLSMMEQNHNFCANTNIFAQNNKQHIYNSVPVTVQVRSNLKLLNKMVSRLWKLFLI
jgi:hypothetical protein